MKGPSTMSNDSEQSAATSAFRHRYPSCESRDLRTSSGGRLSCRDCERRHKLERKARRHRERGDRCSCGTDAVSLNPSEVVAHNWGGGPCRIVPTGVVPPVAKCRDCGADWKPVRRGECSRCGSDNTPTPPATPEASA